MRTLDAGTELLAGEDIERQLVEEVEQAALEERPYCVIACVPQRLPGEGVAEVVRGLSASVRGLVRRSDLPGRPGAEILVVGLPETTSAGARALAYRLQSELSRRSAHLKRTTWEAGVACLPEDGSTANELIEAAIEEAKTRRLRLGLCR